MENEMETGFSVRSPPTQSGTLEECIGTQIWLPICLVVSNSG